MTILANFIRTISVTFLAILMLTFILTPHLASAGPPDGRAISEPISVSSSHGKASPEKSVFSKIITNIGNGFKTVGRILNEWFHSLMRLLGFSREGLPEGASCNKVSDCGGGLVCLNVCFDEESCDVFDKLCAPVSSQGASTVAIKQRYASCGTGDLCTEGTICRRTCPNGVDCEVMNRCLTPPESLGGCEQTSDCKSACGELPFPPIGPSAFRAECRDNACFCETEEVQPDLRITTCPSDVSEEALTCPAGTRPACTGEGYASKNSSARLTCLTDPVFGGQCLTDSGCAEVNCSAGTEPFCDSSDNRCRCHAMEAVTVSCETVDACQGVSCPDGQSRACVSGVCTCEKKVVIEKDFICTSDAQCPSNCPEEFSPACVEGSCACQRVRENVPVSCSDLSDCGGVSCPADFDKICLDDVCACTKTTLQ